MQRQLGGALQQREVDRCALPSSSRASLPRCSAVAQRPRRGAVRTSTAYHHSLEEREPEASTSCPSLPSAADMGMRVNLARLERSFSRSRHGHGGRGSMDTSLFGPGTFLVTLEDKPQRTKNQEKTSDYFANLGDAIRTLRDDIPSLFERDLNYSIYRDDILFKDPRNSFQGIKNYKLIFWSLRFHGSIFFSKLYVEVKRIWQPPTEDNVIKMRLDASGKVYEHVVDNVLLRDPPMLANPLLAGLNLAPLQPQTPQLGAWGSEELQPTVLSADSAAHPTHSHPSSSPQPVQQQSQQHQQVQGKQRRWLASVQRTAARLQDSWSSGGTACCELQEASMTGSS